MCLHWAFAALLGTRRYWKMWYTLVMLAVSSFNHSAGLLYSAKLILVQLAHPKILGMIGAVKEQ